MDKVAQIVERASVVIVIFYATKWNNAYGFAKAEKLDKEEYPR